MPAIYLAHSVGYVDDPDSVGQRLSFDRLDTMPEAVVVECITETVAKHILGSCEDLDPLVLSITMHTTITDALNAYAAMLREAEFDWHDGVTDADALHSEVSIWTEPTLEELS